jgi:hypothetical protein
MAVDLGAVTLAERRRYVGLALSHSRAGPFMAV